MLRRIWRWLFGRPLIVMNVDAFLNPEVRTALERDGYRVLVTDGWYPIADAVRLPAREGDEKQPQEAVA